MSQTHITITTTIPIPHIPGWKVKDVGRYPIRAEHYMFYELNYDRWTGVLYETQLSTAPRIISCSYYVILTPAIKQVEQVTFTPTGEVRCPKIGEWFEYAGGYTSAEDDMWTYSYNIVLRTTRTIEIPA